MRNVRYLFKRKTRDNFKWILFLIGITFFYLNLIEISRQFKVTKCNCKQQNISNIYENVNQNFTQSKKEVPLTTVAIRIENQNKKEKEKENEKKMDKVINFEYPLNVDMAKLVEDVKKGKKVFHQPINVYKSKVIKNCETKCKLKLKTSKLILFVIKSAAQNLERRRAIRETWGKEITVDGFIIRSVFVVGISKNRAVEANIKKEFEKYDDIVQYDFYDQYYNNTLKTIGAINWIITYCKQVTFVLFVDDDYFVSPQNLVKSLKELSKEQIKSLYMGHVWRIPNPVRNPKFKWYVSHVEYPFHKYPPFINAGSYVMSLNTIIDMQIAIQYTQLFRLDDVYLGIVAYKLKIKLLENDNFRVRQIKHAKESIKNIIASHGFKDPYQLKTVWRFYHEIIKT